MINERPDSFDDLPDIPDDEDALLIEKYVDDLLSSEESRTMLNHLERDETFADDVLDSIVLQALLKENGNERENGPAILCSEYGSNRQKHPARFSFLLRPVAILLLCGLVGALAGLIGARHFATQRTTEPRIPETTEIAFSEIYKEATSRAVALIQNSVDVVWEDARSSFRNGDLLEPGWLRFRSGLMSIRFFSGAEIALEGPAEIQILSSNRIFCLQGKISADVPPQAIGFAINAPNVVVVDKGTSFYFEVDENSSTVHVVKGEVELTELPESSVLVKEGQAAAIGRDGRVDRMETAAPPMMIKQRLDRLSADRNHHILRQWREAGLRWNADPSLLIRFDFQELKNDQSEIENLSVEGSKRIGNGILVGCRQTEGPINGMRALEFRRVSDRIRIRNISGEFHSLTYAAWVRVDALEYRFNALFMSNGFNPGNVHWQLHSPRFHLDAVYPDKPNSFLRLGLREPLLTRIDANYDSEPIFPGNYFGQWIHLATVIDGSTRTITHYLNGKPLGSVPFRHETPLRIGGAELGNWNPQRDEDEHPVRHFNGCFGEFMLYSRALNPSEIMEFVHIFKGK